MKMPDRNNPHKLSCQEHNNAYGCQINRLEAMSDHIGLDDRVWQGRNRLKRILKRRIIYVRNYLSEIKENKCDSVQNFHNAARKRILKENDIVRVRSKEEIQATLNRWNQLKGCSLMQEMWQFCNTEQKVFKRVKVFLDERDYLMKKCNGIVILENVFCEGTVDYGPCDRTCFFFWREEWLEKV